jgi:hypothetical protein
VEGPTDPPVSGTRPTQVGSGTKPTNVAGGTKPQQGNEYVDTSNWVKVIAYSDEAATQALTNIQIDPQMIGLEGNNALSKVNEAGISVQQMAEWNNYVKWMKDKGYSGNKQMVQLDKYDILVPDTKAYPLINKVLKYPCLSELYLSTSHFGITTNFEHYRNEPMVNSVKCYVSAKKGEQKFVNKKYVKNAYDFWKVFTPQGSGKGGDVFGNLIIGSPREIASQTYFGFKVGSADEANSLKSYLETDFAN